VGVIAVRRLIDSCAEPGSTGEPFQFYAAPQPHGALTAYAIDGDELWFFAADGTRGRFNYVTGTYLPPAEDDATPVPAPTATVLPNATPAPSPESGLACDLRYDAPGVAPDISQNAAVAAARASFPAGSVGATWPDGETSAVYGHVVNGAAPDADALLWLISLNGFDGAANQAAPSGADVQTLVLVDAVGGFVRHVCAAGRDATPIPTATLTPPFTDPRELAAYFVQQFAASQFDTLQPLLADEYQGFSYGHGRPLDHYTSYFRAGSPFPIDTQPSQWDIEEHDGSTLVIARLRGGLPYPVVMRRLADGTLRLDPGPCALQLAEFWRAQPDGPVAQEPGYQGLFQDFTGDSAALLKVRLRFDDAEGCVSYSDAGVMVTSTWTFRKDVSSLALGDLYWTAGDQRGEARIVWTDALTDDATLRFPTPNWPYSVTIMLDGAPSSAELHLHVNGLTMHDVDGADMVFSLNYSFSGHPYPDPDAPLAPTPEPTATIDRTN
jgi:hypothetical protein